MRWLVSPRASIRAGTASAAAGPISPKCFGGDHANVGVVAWTRLSCHGFTANAVRLQLHTLAYNLANFMRTSALPQSVEHWSLTTLREKLVKIGAKVVRHGRYVMFQLAEAAVPRTLFAEILRLISGLRPRPAPT
jgi:hypothetical protein